MAVLDTLIKKMTLNDQEDEYYDGYYSVPLCAKSK